MITREPAKRAIAVELNIGSNDALPPASRAWFASTDAILGLTPQALR